MSSVLPTVSADEYLRGILAREAVDSAMRSPLRGLDGEVRRVLRGATEGRRMELYPTGAFEKGTANASGRQIDFLASFAPTTTDTVGHLYAQMFSTLDKLGYEPLRRDVSIAITLKNVTLDIIPARREAMMSDVHEVWLPRLKRAIKTNLTQHILDTQASGRREEIRIIKIWRDQQGLDFPSFYLELSVIAALKRRPQAALAENVWAVFGYLENLFPARSVLDPVNAINILSDLLDAAGKDAIRKAAKYARAGRAWSEIVW
jgi:hypothetical protein